MQTKIPVSGPFDPKISERQEAFYFNFIDKSMKILMIYHIFFCFVSNKSDGKGNKNDRGGPFKLEAEGDQKPIVLFA